MKHMLAFTHHMSAFTASTDSLSGLHSMADIQVITCKQADRI